MRPKVVVVLSVPLLLLLASSIAWGQTFQTLTSLQVTFPVMGVVPDSSGNLYGLGAASGAYLSGNIFEVVNAGSYWYEKDLFDFLPSADDGLTGYPSSQGLLVRDANGNLFGDAFEGGRWGQNVGLGYGLVFELNPNGVLTALYEFTGESDGAYPAGGLVADAQGNLYGTAAQGGNTGCMSFGDSISCGVVFELVKGMRNWSYKVIYAFQSNGTDGFNPAGALTFDSAGNLYGTTNSGGNRTGNECQYEGCGTVFKLTPPAPGTNQWTESILYAFSNNGSDGSNPFSGVAVDSSGNLYGVTNTGGDYGNGNVYQLALSGNSYTFNNILSCNNGNCAAIDRTGIKPLVDGSGNVWFASSGGGAGNYGVVFELSAGSWNYTDIHDFTNGSDGESPECTLTLDAAGNIYGTTSGSAYFGRAGTAFEITPAPSNQHVNR